MSDEQLVEKLVNEMITKITNDSKPQHPERLSYKAKSGIGAILSMLRESDEPVMKKTRPEQEEKKEEVIVNRPLNRKERRALQQAELKKKYEESNQEEVSYKKIPSTVPSLRQLFLDEESFQNYRASFGYKSTQTNNYVRFALTDDSAKYSCVASQDRYVRVYKSSELHWKHNMGGIVYDMTWLANTSTFATTSKGHPIHLWNAETGERLAAYIGKDHADAVDSAFSVAHIGSNIIGGYRKDFKIWSVERGGKPIDTFPYFDPNYNSGLNGRALSMCQNPTMNNIFGCVGCSSSIAVYSLQWKSAIATMETNCKSYTHACYSRDGTKLYVSERKGDIHCFDMRTNKQIQLLRREMKVNHRTVFDIDYEHNLLYTGTSSGEIVAFDIGDYNEVIEPIYKLKIASACVPCVSSKADQVVACSGERIFPDCDLIDTDDENETKMDNFTLHASNSFQVFMVDYTCK